MTPPAGPSHERLRVRAVGAVQGVGFRPFVHRLAEELGLAGWVRNDSDGVTLEVEGPAERLAEFLSRFPRERPRASVLYSWQHRFLPAAGHRGFEIVPSEGGAAARVWILPDLATCDRCREEVLDPGDRRHRYPFTNCTHCGPRFSIIRELPYDRPATTMAGFPLCDRCRREYEEPLDRRFHAQPVACESCGPRVTAVRRGQRLAEGEEALDHVRRWLDEGAIVGLKGLGGYHILVDATNEEAVAKLRGRKGRPTKPLAVMFEDLEQAGREVELDSLAEEILRGPAAPILLLDRRREVASELAASIAPGSDRLGAFLPYTPLHLLLMRDFGRPLVCTSGNPTDQPTLHEDEVALRDLDGICDVFLVHDRPIERQVDDSVVQVLRRPQPRPQILRRARGYAPLPLLAPVEVGPAVALGGQMNGALALSRGREIILSQHLGELDSLESRVSYRRILDDLLRLYEVEPSWIAHDLHPDYFTSDLAIELQRQSSIPRFAVQHHHAHLAAALLEHEIEGRALGLCFDGTGYGLDGTVWGGEFLLGDGLDFERVAHLRAFPLPGGEAAVREPWRTAMALAYEAFEGTVPGGLDLESEIDVAHRDGIESLLRAGNLGPLTSSMGRLFDGVAALLGLVFHNTHQARAPQTLEAVASRGRAEAVELGFGWLEGEPARLDERPLVRALVEARSKGARVEDCAAAFHRAVAVASVEVIERVAPPVTLLTGGVFCNRRLTEEVLGLCHERGLAARAHSQLPPTDGALAVGQLWVGWHRRAASGSGLNANAPSNGESPGAAEP